MYLTAKLHHLTGVPKGSTYLGGGDFDMQCKECPPNMKERLAEFDDKLKKVYKKPGFTKEVKAEKEAKIKK